MRVAKDPFSAAEWEYYKWSLNLILSKVPRWMQWAAAIGNELSVQRISGTAGYTGKDNRFLLGQVTHETALDTSAVRPGYPNTYSQPSFSFPPIARRLEEIHVRLYRLSCR